jgi:hypothetical protein
VCISLNRISGLKERLKVFKKCVGAREAGESSRVENFLNCALCHSLYIRSNVGGGDGWRM